MKNRATFLILTSLVAAMPQLRAQDGSAIERRLVTEYTITQATADRKDIVTPGSVIVLKKNNLMMVDASNPNPYQNTYKSGKITQNALGRLVGWGNKFGAKTSDGDRTYVTGEKMWLTKIDVSIDGVSLELLTDELNDVRYRASLKFPFPKGSIPSADQVAQEVAEVFAVQPVADTGESQAPAPAQQAFAPVQAPQGFQQQFAPAAPSDAQMTPIAPPPPPADVPPPAPRTLSLGQTVAEVVAMLGQPLKMANLGAKDIYYYKDLKITFVAGKLSDVQ